MPTVGARIKQVRTEKKMSADLLAERLGKNRATVYRYEKDEIEDMSINVVGEIAKVLNVDPMYLMGYKNNPEDTWATNEYTYLPTSISAGLPNEVEGIMQADKITIPDVAMGKWAGNNEIYMARTNGDSMNRIIPNNSLIAIKPIELHELNDNDIVVYRNGAEYAVKRFEKHNDKLVFRPDSNSNSFTDDVILLENADDLSIKGKVVMWIVTMD